MHICINPPQWVNTLRPRQIGHYFCKRHLQICIFLNENFDFQMKFHWSLFLGVLLTICQQWFRWWLCVDQTTSHYLNHWWPSLVMHLFITLPQWINENTKSGTRGPNFTDDFFPCKTNPREILRLSSKLKKKSNLNKMLYMTVPKFVLIWSW